MGAASKKADYTRYWCDRCRRKLVNDPSVKGNPGDTVSPGKGDRFTHDQCGGSVRLHSGHVS